jgi:hypothetical protein
MAKQIEGRRWRFHPTLRPKLAVLLVGVWFDNLFVVQHRFVMQHQFVVQHQFFTEGQTVNSTIYVEFLKNTRDVFGGKTPKILIKKVACSIYDSTNS